MDARGIRALYVDSGVGLGGGQVNLIEILRSLDPNAVVPVVAAPPESGVARWCFENGVKLVPLPFRSAPPRPLADYLGSFYGVFFLARQIRAHRADVVHANTFKAGLVGGLAAVLAGAPMVFQEQAQITHWPLDGLVGLLARRIIAVSKAVAAKHLPRFEEKLRIIPPGVDTGRFTRIEHARPACTVCFIGRLSEEKGIDILVESAPLVLRDVPEARFVVRGVPFTVEDRDFFARVKRRIEDLGLTSTFEFPDYVREIPDLLRRIDVLVVPSRRDAMPRVVLEAMALGKPVVAASVGGLPEQISNGKTGLLVRPASAEDLADAVVNLLRHPDLARSMGLEGRRVVEERYSLAATTKSIAGVYAEIVHSG